MNNLNKSHFTSKCSIYKHLREYDFTAGSSTGFPNPCFGYILCGSSRFVSSDREIPLEKYDLVFIPKGQIYTSHWHADPNVEFYSLNFEFMSPIASRNMFEFSKVHAPELKPYLDRLFTILQTEDDSCGYESFACFYKVLDYASKHLKKARADTVGEVAVAVDYIESHSNGEIRVADLARMCCMSESKFYSCFKATTGYTPTDYKNLMKVRRVEELISYNELTLEQVCEECGFSSPSFLRRIYRKFTGMTPSEYINRMKTSGI